MLTIIDEAGEIAAQLSADADLPLERAVGLPPAAYRSHGFAALEAERVFHGDWVCVARVDDVAEPGDYVAVDLAGEAIMVTRDAGGALHCLSRACRHRGMDVLNDVESGRGNAARLTCPYHTWSYRLDGTLAGAPEMQRAEGFRPEDCSLVEFALDVWQGFVFVCLADDPPPFHDRFRAVEKALGGLDLSDLRTAAVAVERRAAADWKVAYENAIEGYHFIGVHRKSLRPLYPLSLMEVDADETSLWAWTGVSDDFADGFEDGKPLHPAPLPPLEGAPDRLRFEPLTFAIWPNFFVVVAPDRASWFEFWPEGAGVHVQNERMLLPAATLESGAADDIDDFVNGTFRIIIAEDLHGIEGVQRGINGARGARAGRLSHHEVGLWGFHRYLARMIGSDAG